MNLNISQHVGRIPSLIYRVLLCIYVFCNLNHCFDFPQVLINLSISALFIAYYVFRVFSKDNPTMRLIDTIVDIANAGAVIYFYNQWDWYSGSFIYLMILCTENGSHYLKRVATLSICIFISFYIFLTDFRIGRILPVFLFVCFIYIDHYISTFYQKRNGLNNIIDDFFISTRNGKSYNIYREAIKLLKRKPFRINLTDIFCFRQSDNSLYLVNGTKFIWTYRLHEDKMDLEKIINNPGFNTIKIKLDGVTGEEHPCFVHRDWDNGISYIYIMQFNPQHAYELTLIKEILLSHLFTRMSKVIESELLIKEREIRGLQEIQQKMSYVNMANNTMHFIRNKLSPLKDYIAIMTDYENSDDAKKEMIRPHLLNEYEQVKQSFIVILERADFMLEKSSNPFVFTQTEKHGPQQLFSDIKLIWRNYGLDEAKINAIVTGKIEGERKYIYYNTDALNIVLDNWISNICKYNNGLYEFSLIEHDQDFEIQFMNNFKRNKESKEDFIKLYNDNNKAEITKKKYHGLHVIHDYLDQMDISSRLEKIDDTIVFTITIYKQIEYLNNEKDPDNRR